MNIGFAYRSMNAPSPICTASLDSVW